MTETEDSHWLFLRDSQEATALAAAIQEVVGRQETKHRGK